MQLPGEKLLIRLWESIEKLSIGALEPYQIKRLANAQRQVEVEQILHENRLQRTKKDLELINEIESISPESKYPLNAILEQRNREEQNALGSIKHAYAQLLDENQESVSESVIEDDWLHRWYSYASKISDDQLQQLWGKMLAGEIKSKNSISYRMMDFIDKLTSKEIDEISTILSLFENTNQILIRGCKESIPFFERNGMDSKFIQKYTDLGIIASSTSGAVSVYSTFDFEKYVSFELKYGDDVFLVSHADGKREKKTVIFYGLGSNGKELVTLSDYSPNHQYLAELFKDLETHKIKIKEKGIT